MLTQDDIKRWSAKCDGSILLDTNLKPEILKGQVSDCVEQIHTKLKRTGKGRKVLVCWGETK